jgi:hypothetical protein
LADIAENGWLPADPEQAAVVELALTGFYKQAGVDLNREQIESNIACWAYDVADEGLVIWPEGDYATKAVYDLRDGPVLRPLVVARPPRGDLPMLRTDQLLFRTCPVEWSAWVEAWERDQAGTELPKPLAPGVRVLPPVTNSP